VNCAEKFGTDLEVDLRGVLRPTRLDMPVETAHMVFLPAVVSGPLGSSPSSLAFEVAESVRRAEVIQCGLESSRGRKHAVVFVYLWWD
jgi:hypothetical protein